MNPTCETCPYWARGRETSEDKQTIAEALWGECRRHTPQHGTPRDGGSWPTTRPSEWCGEHPDIVMEMSQ